MQTLTLCVLESSLGLPCAVRTGDEGRPGSLWEETHVIQPSTERPGLPSTWAMEPTSSLPTSLLPHEMMLWGLVFLLQSPEAAGVMVSYGVWGRSEEGGLLLEFIPLPQSQLAKLFGRHGKYPGEVLS